MSIKENVVSLAATIAPLITIGKDGEPKADGLSYGVGMPEGLTPDIANQLDEYDSTFRAATALAFGDTANAAFKKHKGLDTVSIDIPMAGKNVWSLQMDRTKTFTNLQDATKPHVKHGVMSSGYDVHEASASRGQLKKVKDQLAADALASFGAV